MKLINLGTTNRYVKLNIIRKILFSETIKKKV